ncbi:MAG: YidC/Oxa1 family membrane protein insertase [Clostridiales bacterium]|nr:YidC/Oxa1 family membrane protein insertase [Clostridiales bacterium]
MIIIQVLKNIFLAPLELVFEAIFQLSFYITRSEGWSILLLSLVVSTLVLPLYKRAEKLESEQREKEKELSHWVEHIKKHFHGDEKYMVLSAYYRENHYSPLSQLKSSISLLLQIPFFLAAYDLLGVRAAERFAGTGGGLFGFDLGAPDGLLSFAGITINALPILMTLVNILACYIYTKGYPFKTALRSYLLAIFFLVFLYKSPSALLVYWTMNNFYSLFKTIIMKNAQNKAEKGLDPDASGSSLDKQEGSSLKAGSRFGGKPSTSVFVLAAVYMAVLTGLLIPLSYLSASPSEFINIVDPQNPLHYLWSSFFVAVGFYVFWPSVFYYLAPRKPKLFIAFALFCMSVFSTVNYLFFGSDTGSLNTSLVFDVTPSHSVQKKIVNVLVVLAIVAACFLFYRFKTVIRFVFFGGIMTLLTVSFFSARTVQKSYRDVSGRFDEFQEISSPKITLTQDGQNVMVIMLDKAVSAYIPYIFHEFPELYEQYDGFSYYPNTMSFGPYTLQTTSALFGGYEYTPERMDARADESLAEKHDEALRVMPVLFSNEGYVTSLMELPFAGWTWQGDYSSFEDIENCNAYYPVDYYNDDTESHENTETRRNRNLFMYGIFRCSPLVLQDLIYDSGDYLSVRKDAFNKYNVLQNYKVLENLDNMTTIDNSYPGGLFLFNNETAHDLAVLKDYNPYTLGNFEENFTISNGEKELEITEAYQAATYECLVAAIRELGNYMDHLKELGVYDNTRIIIVSDHATEVRLFDELQFDGYNMERFNCLLMVKDFNSTGFTTDYTFMTNADVPTIAMEGIVEDPINPGTGNPVNSDLKEGDIYVDYSTAYDGLGEARWNLEYNDGNTFSYDEEGLWFKVVNGDIFDKDSWILVDRPE